MIPPRIRLSGNLPVAGFHIPNGHSQLEVLKNSMKFQNLSISESTVRYPSGAIITCVSNSGLDYIDIYAPLVSGAKRKTELTWKAGDDYLIVYEDCDYSYQYLYNPSLRTLSLIDKYARLSFNFESAVQPFGGDTNGLPFYSTRQMFKGAHHVDFGYFNYWTSPDAPSDAYDCTRLTGSDYYNSKVLPYTHTLSSTYGNKVWYMIVNNATSRYDGLYVDKQLFYGHTVFGSQTGNFACDIVGHMPFNERDVFIKDGTHLYGYASFNHAFILDTDTEESHTRHIFGCCRRTFDTDLIHQEKLEYRNLVLNKTGGSFITNEHTHYQHLNYIGTDPMTVPNRAAWNALCLAQLGYDMYTIPPKPEWYPYNFCTGGYIKSAYSPYEDKFYPSTVEVPYKGKIYNSMWQCYYQPLDYLFYHDIKMELLELPLTIDTYGAEVAPLIHHAVGDKSSLILLNYINTENLGVNVFYQEKTRDNQMLEATQWIDKTEDFLALFETVHGSEFFPRYLQVMTLHSTEEGRRLDKVIES